MKQNRLKRRCTKRKYRKVRRLHNYSAHRTRPLRKIRCTPVWIRPPEDTVEPANDAPQTFICKRLLKTYKQHRSKLFHFYKITNSSSRTSLCLVFSTTSLSAIFGCLVRLTAISPLGRKNGNVFIETSHRAGGIRQTTTNSAQRLCNTARQATKFCDVSLPWRSSLVGIRRITACS